MKKIMFLFAALSMAVLCSCGSANKSEQEEMDKFKIVLNKTLPLAPVLMLQMLS